MQAALDSTALMLAKDLTEGTITTSQISAKADAYFKALYTNPEAKSLKITATYTQNSGNGSTILVNGAGAIDTTFMRVAGFPTMDFKTSSTSAWGNVRMRVAMALDVTGSMSSSGKMGAMQTAAKNLVDQLSAARQELRATSTSRWFPSPRTSTSAPATRMRPGSTGIDVERSEPDLGHLQQRQQDVQEFLPDQPQQGLDAGHRPSGPAASPTARRITTPKHDADLDERADDGRGRRICCKGLVRERH